MTRWILAILCLSQAVRAEPDRLAEATLERRVFRQTLVGGLRQPARRLTWVLYRGRDTTRLEVFCQDGKPVSKGISLQGAELDESSWLPPAVVRYVGKADGPFRYDLVAEEAPPRCPGAPERLRLTCKLGRVAVRPAGAKLFPGERRRGDDVVAGVWKPARTETVSALRCRRPDDAIPAGGFEEDWPLVFVPATELSPGVEWAHENSDMTVQEGAYRRLAPGR